MSQHVQHHRPCKKVTGVFMFVISALTEKRKKTRPK